VEVFFGPLRKTFRPKRDTFYITLSLFRGNVQTSDRGQNDTEQREQESASLNYELFFCSLSNSLVGHLAKCELVLSQFTSVTTCQLDIPVQDIKNALAYAIHDFLFTVRDYGLTQFGFGRPEYVKCVIIRFHSLYHLSANRRWSVLSGIHRFENTGYHRYPVTDLEVGTQVSLLSCVQVGLVETSTFFGVLLMGQKHELILTPHFFNRTRYFAFREMSLQYRLW